MEYSSGPSAVASDFVDPNNSFAMGADVNPYYDPQMPEVGTESPPDPTDPDTPDGAVHPGIWLPLPAGWAVETRIQLKGMTSLPATLQAEGGATGSWAPGGTSGFRWQLNAIDWPADGMRFNTTYGTFHDDPHYGGGVGWISAGVQTTEHHTAPVRYRVYEKLEDFNLGCVDDPNASPGHPNGKWGLKKCNLTIRTTKLPGGQSDWNTEVDFDESHALVGEQSFSQVSLHDESSAQSIKQYSQTVRQDLNWHCYEVELYNATITSFVDGVRSPKPPFISSRHIPTVRVKPIPIYNPNGNSFWARLCAYPHPLCVQTQADPDLLWATNHALTSGRIISGIEVLKPSGGTGVGD